MANVIITSTTSSSLTAKISDLQYPANQYDEFSLVVYKDDVEVANPHWTSASSSNYTSKTVTGLEPNTLYYVEGYAKWDGVWYLAGSDSATTDQLNPPSTPTNLRCTYKDYEKVKLEWDASTGADGYKIYLDGSYVGSVPNTTATIFGLSSSTTYQFCVSAYNNDGESSRTCLNVTTDSQPVTRPPDWQWSYNIQSGGDVYNTVFDNGIIKVYIMPATEWNDFTARINEFRNYKGLSNYNFTTVYSEDDCTPSIINEAVNAINEMGFNIPTVTNGNVLASVFIDMRDSLNSIQ